MDLYRILYGGGIRCFSITTLYLLFQQHNTECWNDLIRRYCGKSNGPLSRRTLFGWMRHTHTHKRESENELWKNPNIRQWKRWKHVKCKNRKINMPTAPTKIQISYDYPSCIRPNVFILFGNARSWVLKTCMEPMSAIIVWVRMIGRRENKRKMHKRRATIVDPKWFYTSAKHTCDETQASKKNTRLDGVGARVARVGELNSNQHRKICFK